MAKVIVICEGGLVTDVVADEPVEVAVIDYDTEGAEADELTRIPQHRELPGVDMKYADACVSVRDVQVGPERANQLFKAVQGE